MTGSRHRPLVVAFDTAGIYVPFREIAAGPVGGLRASRDIALHGNF